MQFKIDRRTTHITTDWAVGCDSKETEVLRIRPTASQSALHEIDPMELTFPQSINQFTTVLA
jgi:hypothetical protein